MKNKFVRILSKIALWFVGISVALVLVFKFVPVFYTPLMLTRSIENKLAGNEMVCSHNWVPLEHISKNLQKAVIASEDGRFLTHHGFDFEAIQKAMENNEQGKKLKGGSTISQQTAKNVFLWPDRTWIRKGLETGFTLYIEAMWPKQRIMEMYLNVVEWAPGVYGAEAAARHHFKKSASALSAHEAAALAAVLPNPRKWNASNPGPYVQGRTTTLQGRAARVGALANCLQNPRL